MKPRQCVNPECGRVTSNVYPDGFCRDCHEKNIVRSIHDSKAKVMAHDVKMEEERSGRIGHRSITRRQGIDVR